MRGFEPCSQAPAPPPDLSTRAGGPRKDGTQSSPDSRATRIPHVVARIPPSNNEPSSGAEQFKEGSPFSYHPSRTFGGRTAGPSSTPSTLVSTLIRRRHKQLPPCPHQEQKRHRDGLQGRHRGMTSWPYERRALTRACAVGRHRNACTTNDWLVLRWRLVAVGARPTAAEGEP